MKIAEITRSLKLNTIKLYTDIPAQNRKYWPKNSRKGEIAINFFMFFVTAIILANLIGPKVWLTKKIDKSMHTTQDKVIREAKCMVGKKCLNPLGCPTTPNDGCCEVGETPAIGNMDCILKAGHF